MAHPYLEKLQNLVDEIVPGHTDIECKHFFSGAAAYTEKKIFASLTPKRLAFKLPESRCDQILSDGLAEPLRYFDKSPVKRGYVLFAAHEKLATSELRKYFLESKSSVEKNAG